MDARWLRAGVIAAGATVVASALTGCGGGDEETESPYRYRLGNAEIAGPGRGLGEWSGDGGGGRRVIQVADSEADAQTPESRTVTALVEVCAPQGHPLVTSGSDWRLVLDEGGYVDASGSLQPTEDASPAIASSGRVDPGECAFANVDFALPEQSLSVGMVYRAPHGELVRWSWFPNEAHTDDT